MVYFYQLGIDYKCLTYIFFPAISCGEQVIVKDMMMISALYQLRTSYSQRYDDNLCFISVFALNT